MNRRSMIKLIILVVAIIAAFVGGTIAYRHLSRTVGRNASSALSEADAEGRNGPARDKPEVITDDAQAAAEEPAGDSDLQTAADFTVYDMDGNTHSLSEFFGTPLVVNFWATWCPPCRGELPDFQEMYERYSGEVTFLMVDLTTSEDSGQKDVQTFLEENGYTFPVYLDLTGDAAGTYAVNAIPETVFITSEGNISNIFYGSIDGTTLEEQIAVITGQ